MTLQLEEVLSVVEKVIRENHAYYMAHPDYPMPKPCMWPDELMGEIKAQLAQQKATSPASISGAQ